MPEFFRDYIQTKKPHIDEAGILRVPATINRVGVQEYPSKNGGIERRLRLPEEVEKSADTFSRQIITLNHPEKEFVTAENAHIYMKGLSSEAVYKDGFTDTFLTVTHKDAVIAATTTHKQLSCGYWADIEYVSGVWVDELGVQGEKGKSYEYDSIQRNIRGNHIALVERGRAGEKASIHDAMVFDSIPSIISESNYHTKKLMQIVYKNQILTIDGDDANKVKTLIDELTTAIEQTETKLKDAIAQKDALESEKRVIEGTLTGEKQTIKNLEAQLAETKDTDITGEIKARLEAFSEVAGHLDSIDYSLTVPEIRKAYLLAAYPSLKEQIATADEGFINGMYTALKPAKTSKVDELKGVLDSAKPIEEEKPKDGSDITKRRMNNLPKGGAK